MARTAKDIAAEMRDRFHTETIGVASDPQFNLPKIPTGSLVLDQMMKGGWRLGRSYQFYGQEGSGKTTLAYMAMASGQRYAADNPTEVDGEPVTKIVAFVDAEGSFDADYASKCGIDVGEDRCIVTQPEYGDTAFDRIEYLLRTKMVQVIVCDSVAALLPKRELDKSAEDKTIGELASLMSRGMRKITPHIGDCIVIFINQVRENIGVMFGSPITTP